MPRVIKEVPPKEQECDCEHCSRRIAYVRNDVQESHGTDYGGGPDGAKWIDCPGEGCGKRIILERW